MIVRRAEGTDAAALVPLVQGYWAFEGICGGSARGIEAQLTHLLATPSLGAAWIARDETQAVGYALLVYVFSLEHQGLTAELDELFVLPEQRGAGLGAQLLRAAETEAERRGCTNLSLQIASSNLYAKEFYRRRGYAERPRYQLLDKPLGGA